MTKSASTGQARWRLLHNSYNWLQLKLLWSFYAIRRSLPPGRSTKGDLMTENVIDIGSARHDRIQWNTLFFVAVFHILAGWSLFNLSWTGLIVSLVLWWISGSLGIGVGYHRLQTHRGFKAPRWLERVLATFGTLALQSGPISWVTTHRLHHAYTDTERDPHSPQKGFWWAHMGWLFRGTAQVQPEAIRRRYSPDLLRDPFMVFLDNYYWLTTVVVAGALLAFFGWQVMLMGIFLRTVFGWHATWLVNSATHMWGYRRFESRDDSRNNALVAAVSFGEGWHNNHHTYPRSARHGLTWSEPDINWMQIRVLERLGLATEVYAYSLEAAEKENELKKAA